MVRFVVSCSLVYAAMCVCALVMSQDELRGEGRMAMSAVFSSWIAPTLAVWLAAEGLQLVWPRRALDRRISMPVKRIGLGVAAGVVGTVLGVLGMAALDRTVVPDAALMGVAGAVAALVVLVPTERSRRGVCVYCGYSQVGATPGAGGVCVECGKSAYSG
jgi:FtsH-binding integral membrane protein